MSEQAIDVDVILNAPSSTMEYSYNQRDAIIYALGIGENDLMFTFENHEKFSIFPLYPVVLGFKGTSSDVVPFPPPHMVQIPEGIPDLNPAMLLHGEQEIEILKPLNPEGDRLRAETKIISFYDKGSGTLMETETQLFNPQGELHCRLISGTFIRGLTGFQGKGRTLPPRTTIPSRLPDATYEDHIPCNQALIYRLSGDYNPLHADLEMAESLGYKKPILHGLCSMGYATRAVMHTYCQGTPESLKHMKVRFTKPFYPGETIVTKMWKSSNSIVIQCECKERSSVILVGEVKIANYSSNQSKL